MQNRFAARLLVLSLCLIGGLRGVAAVPNRIAGTLSEGSRVALAHSVSPAVVASTDAGAVDGSQRLDGMMLHFSMTDAQQAELTQLLAEQQDSASPQFRKWLTPAEFGAQFGLSAADVAQASAWLTAKGFTVDKVANSATFLRFSGTVAQVQSAFGTSVRHVTVNGTPHIANVTELTLPRGLAGVVGNVSGISDFRPKPHVSSRSVTARAAQPNYTTSTSTGIEHNIAPGDFYTIYDMKPLLASTPAIDGTGVTIAVMGGVDVSLSDIAAFRTASGLSANPPTVKVYGTDPGSPTGSCAGNNPPASCAISSNDVVESELDLEWAGATAPSSHLTFVISTDVIRTSLVNAIDDNLAPIMTVSYGACEKAGYVFSASDLTSLNLSFQQANAQGITVVAASGDAGATDCDDSGVRSATQGLWVDFPASSPYVTGLGGTEFVEGSGTYWSATNGANGGSALSYIPETVWNDTAADLLVSSSATLSAGGGGASTLFGKPAWQVGTGVPSDGHRDVPDLSFSSSADHDAYLVCILGDCSSGGYFSTSGFSDAVGGTSVAAPSFAGIVALVEQRLGGTRLGNVNPYIYSLAGGNFASQIFHDVTTGNNKSPCTTGSTNCPSGGTIGYSATTGYDLASGWGSLDVFQFVNNFSSATLQKSTTTTVTSTPANPNIAQSVTFTATVAGPSGTTAVPTGTVAFSINGGAATTVAVGASGTATLTTTFNTGGPQTVTAVYSGDTTFYASTGVGTATVTVPAGVPTTTALTASASTVALTGSLTLTASVSSTTSGTLAGTVTFSAGSTVLSTVPLVAGAGGNTGTAVLTLTVSAATLPIGNNSITATFNGGGTPAGALSYFPSTSSAVVVAVTNPTITLSATNITMADGGSGTSTVTVTAGGGYAGTVGFTASSTSSAVVTYAGASFNPVSVALAQAATGTTVLTISTPSATAAVKGAGKIQLIGGISLLAAGGGVSLAGLLFFGFGRGPRRRLPALLMSLLAFAAFSSMMGCGSSSTTGGGTTYSVPKGVYTITVTGTDASNTSISASTTFSLTLN